MVDEKSKNKLVEREKEILAFWRDNDIFKKTLEKNKDSGKEFVFYEGPPTANGHPHIGHLETRAFKDAIPRYKTMRGFYVRRKGGWDTHGLPVEIQVEKELGLKSKKEIEEYGIARFNERCKESVWKYVREWEDFTGRSGFWVDLENPYITYKPAYIESLWNIIKTVDEKGLLYKDYKVVPWCPRCGTALSSHELAQGYEDVKDLSVTVKFEVRKAQGASEASTYLLAWTTTPWTLPGNVALAVNKKVIYVKIENVKIKNQNDNSKLKNESTDNLILARDRLQVIFKDYDYDVVEEFTGDKLVGLEYEPLFPFTKEPISGVEKEKLKNAYKVYPADFVTTEEGTGIVHTAVMYGQDDFELGTKIGLPKFHLVNEDGTFKKEAGFLAGKFVKDQETDVVIIKDLAHRGLLFAKEKYQHSYPFCWRCKTPLIYFARDSWYIKMSALRDKLVKENESINWEPSHLKEGRFGEWLREVKDWAISRERYWGTPLPVWQCEKCGKRKVLGSVDEIKQKPDNSYFIMRHGETESNVKEFLNTDPSTPMGLTEKGKRSVEASASKLVTEKIDIIYTSPFPRTKETSEIVRKTLGMDAHAVIEDERLREISGASLERMPIKEYSKMFSSREERFTKHPEGGGENFSEIKRRLGDFLYDTEKKNKGKRILIITHEAPGWLLASAAVGLDIKQASEEWTRKRLRLATGEFQKLEFFKIPHNADYELDLHRPHIDEVKLKCEACASSTGSGQGGEMKRTKEVMDVWFDSGAMPFAQDHYPFENKELIDGGFLRKAKGYPADFISEAIDQTRGWFYTLHAIGVLLGKGKAYRNVVCFGHVRDAEGKKMSKSVGNVVDPFFAMDKFGADPLRFWMYSINQAGESKNFDERTVDEVVKKVFNLASNVLTFYEQYASAIVEKNEIKSSHVLDRWILARLNQLTADVTDGLENYKFLEPTRAIRDFIADLSQWYVRRSRDRLKYQVSSIKYQVEAGEEKEKREDKQNALVTTRFVLLELSKLMAPFTPFFAEHLYQQIENVNIKNQNDNVKLRNVRSVHLESWPEVKKVDDRLLSEMSEVRKVVSLALEARAKANIKVRQPISTLKVASLKLKGKEDLINLVIDEVNVKEVLFDAKLENEVQIDIEITPELKKEGDVREVIRTIQELRKQKGLKPGELAVLATSSVVATSGLLQEFEGDIKKVTSLSRIEHGLASAGDFELK